MWYFHQVLLSLSLSPLSLSKNYLPLSRAAALYSVSEKKDLLEIDASTLSLPADTGERPFRWNDEGKKTSSCSPSSFFLFFLFHLDLGKKI